MMMLLENAPGPIAIPGFLKLKFLTGTPPAPGENVIGTDNVAPVFPVAAAVHTA